MFVSVASNSSSSLQTNPKRLPESFRGSVLFIDDEEVIRDIGSEMLQHLGLTCLTAANGQDGIDLFKKNPAAITLVILDVEMPGLSGEKVYRLLKEINPDLRVLICSGYSKEYLENKVFKSKIENFIPKPFNLENLIYQINRLFPKENVR